MPVDAKRDELLVAVGMAMREITGISVLHSHAMAAALGINSTDLECLDLVMLRGRVAAGELAETTGLTTGAITGVIDRLEKGRFVRRERDPSDRRKVFVQVLPAIRRQVNPLGEPMQHAVLAVLATYKNEELEMLLGIFSRVQEAALAAIEELREGTAAKRARRKRS
jgi:DNA-binding MarR family transcriptional regulator